MADLRVTTNTKLDGPWLIAKEQIETLDKAIEDAFEKIKSHFESRFAEAVEQDFQERLRRHHEAVRSERHLRQRLAPRGTTPQEQEGSDEKPTKPRAKLRERLRAQATEAVQGRYGYSAPVKKIKIDVEGDKNLQGESFSEMMKQPSADSVKPLSLEVDINHNYGGQPFCTLSISSYGDLRISAGPEGSPAALAAFNSVKDWAVSIQAPRWQRAWMRLYGLQWFAFFGVVVACLSLSQARRPESPYFNEAHALLASGVTPQNQTKAIELTLALTSGYIPPNTPQQTPALSRAAAMAIIAIAFAVAMIAHKSPPDFALGIGLGAKTVDRWRRWLATVRRVPAFLVTLALIPKLKELVFGWLGW